ncbi:hypothetical protein [Aphanothece sacrum]|uniref:Uncharacterized protein n=1 Tax=Aphanothece sacrum FPU1 TaxID=1920663 RepID=A0A401IHZ7_APHSA|nr:hypothetical protein [Aphanothece sacrum]GBF80751.1 hypothetical protein AsFPU1_2156 [Aphanothece sacrum FPU1]GBF83246.1 hypothetical protein AsFPU3_0286 [Aphanothece sacrum FPU3]
MKQIIKNLKVSEIPDVIAQLGLSPEQKVDLTIEETSDDLLSIMDKIGAKAQAQGLTEEKLQELLADES